MIKIIKNFIKRTTRRLKCEHKWNPEVEIDSYYDYSGFKVRVFECKCSKCGKRKTRKYW